MTVYHKNSDVAFMDGDVGFARPRNSFIEVVDNLVSLFRGDTELELFCRSRWNRTLTVKKQYKQRVEINIKDLPLILITRPSVNKSFLIGARDGTHTLRLYVGFLQNDRREALNDFIEFEEYLDDAITRTEPGDLGAINIKPLTSENDEGINHPQYFMVMDVEIKHRR